MKEHVARALVASALLLGCQKSAAPAPSTSSAAAPPTPATPSSLLQAELRRDRNAVSEEDLTAESDVRRAAAVRALARIQDELSFEPLAKALADEDVKVLSWAAMGVGALCRGREPEAVRRLAGSSAQTRGAGREPGRRSRKPPT
jgi:HEAT repeat protein